MTTDQPAARCAHFVLVPLMAQGHIIPFVDMAHFLARHGAHVTFLTTPLNALRIDAIIQRASASGLSIDFVSLPFPCADAGIPLGCENLDALPSPMRDYLPNFIRACDMLRGPFTAHLRLHPLSPSCVISDGAHPWTGEMARDLGVPRLIFHGLGAFTILARLILHQEDVYVRVTDESEILDVPGFPHPLRVPKGKAPGTFWGPKLEHLRLRVMEEEAMADGVVVNTFDDIEAVYVESHQKMIGKRVWTVGPLCLCNKDAGHMAARGNKAAIDDSQYLRWLDSMTPTSIIYVSFGSLVIAGVEQIMEIGMALEGAGFPFVWVIKAGDRSATEVERWLAESGLEERTRGRGLVIRGWAPQMMILSHPAAGGFLTHCGWNSTLEGICSGLPMATWPHFGDQHMNQKVVVEVLRIGVAVGGGWAKWGDENSGTVVSREKIEKAVRELMGGGKEAEARRERAKELGEKAKRAMEEGGSSYQNLTMLIRQFQEEAE
ncbi:UDP-glycosyltransferase 73C2-like [Curcuma longa]|uniref:UDP-glycosyltransferase 73C2-like n=1 Tax=Curcuma longa TaxID=136217 RepID=UPI003D9E6794